MSFKYGSDGSNPAAVTFRYINPSTGNLVVMDIEKVFINDTSIGTHRGDYCGGIQGSYVWAKPYHLTYNRSNTSFSDTVTYEDSYEPDVTIGGTVNTGSSASIKSVHTDDTIRVSWTPDPDGRYYGYGVTVNAGASITGSGTNYNLVSIWGAGTNPSITFSANACTCGSTNADVVCDCTFVSMSACSGCYRSGLLACANCRSKNRTG